MGSKSKKGTKRQMNFSDSLKYLSDLQDQKHLEYTKHFTQTLASLKVRIEAVEEVLIEKLGETDETLKNRLLTRVERAQGFQEVTTPVQKGSIIRVKVKEEVIGSESDSTPMQDAFMCVGHNQINANLDALLLGALTGETRDITLPDPSSVAIQRKLTATVVKIFKGEESLNEAQAPQEAVTEASIEEQVAERLAESK